MLVGAAALAGCRTDVTVSISQRLDGSGRVSVRAVLDRDAVSRAGDLTTLFRLDDLRARGWQVVGPAPYPPGGRVEFRAEKYVGTPQQTQLALAEIGGDGGPFAGLGVTRRRTPLSVRSAVEGQVDLTAGYAAFGDPRLAQQLASGTQLGVDPAEVARQFGAPLEQLVPLHLDVELPGVRRSFDLRPGQTVQVAVSSSTWNIKLLIAGLAFLVAAVVLVLAWRVNRRSGPSSGA